MPIPADDPRRVPIVSSEDKLIGQNQATVVQLQDLVNSNAPLFTAIVFRLAPDKLMIFVTQQQDRLDSADFQGILNSLSLSPDQPIVVPTTNRIRRSSLRPVSRSR